MDKIAIEDFLNFQDASIKIIEGYYFKKENKKILDVIKNLFDLRLKYKKEENDPALKLVKLMLNSCYGKTSLRHSDTVKKIINNKDLNKFIERNYRLINKIITITRNKKKIHVVDILSNKLSHFNRVHCGAVILSMSK